MKTPTLIYQRKDGNWSLQVLRKKEFHETLLIPENKPLLDLSQLEIAEIIDAYQERYLTLMSKRNIKYISIIHPNIFAKKQIKKDYSQKSSKCAYCKILKNPKRDFENSDFAVLGKRILPKKHQPYFERITNQGKLKAAEALKAVIGLRSRLFLRTSPCDGRVYDNYHWHFEIK